MVQPNIYVFLRDPDPYGRNPALKRSADEAGLPQGGRKTSREPEIVHVDENGTRYYDEHDPTYKKVATLIESACIWYTGNHGFKCEESAIKDITKARELAPNMPIITELFNALASANVTGQPISYNWITRIEQLGFGIDITDISGDMKAMSERQHLAYAKRNELFYIKS